ncbi:hypothetical protein HZS55_09995 [Halosimplex rubrum]|uniref:Uncharacterized protein n=1 Tax=Halosimplex rubrum TaxID=869889 RepID=A0A7D5T006_9EURY|nr:hypothetical protein [Halosimplex rubrum]QLH77608.1 hypothetical protein HZS55_09995 [Halosimplex rubrum]
MQDEAWRSVEVVRNNNGEPHVLQQKVTVYTAGVSEESSGYTKPEIQHRLVPLESLVEFDG